MGTIAEGVSQKSIRSIIGPNPFLVTMLIWGSIYAGSIGLVTLLVVNGSKYGVVLFFVVAILLFFLLFPFAKSFGFSLGGYMGGYRRARKAIQNGMIDPDWAVRGAACTTIAMVDEKTRRIYINGTVYDFDDVKNLGWVSNPNDPYAGYALDFYMRSGSMPVNRIEFGNEHDMRQALGRLSNVLGIHV